MSIRGFLLITTAITLGCRENTGPEEPPPPSVIGTYALVLLNGQSLPLRFNNIEYTAGELAVRGDSTFTMQTWLRELPSLYTTRIEVYGGTYTSLGSHEYRFDFANAQPYSWEQASFMDGNSLRFHSVNGSESSSVLLYRRMEGDADRPPVREVILTPSVVTLLPGETVQLIAVPADSVHRQLTGRTVTFESTNPEVVSVSNTGLVTGVKPGTTMIHASCEQVRSNGADVAVLVPVGSASVSPATVSLPAGVTMQFMAHLKDAGGSTLSGSGRKASWISANPAVATVAGSGVSAVVTAVSEGTATITVTVEGSSASALVTVTPRSALVLMLSNVRIDAPVVPLCAGSPDCGTPWTALLINAGTASIGSPQDPIYADAWLEQGTARRAAGHRAIDVCGQGGYGVIRPGACQLREMLRPLNTAAGTGTLMPGAAVAILQITRGTGSSMLVFDSVRVAVTLIGP